MQLFPNCKVDARELHAQYIEQAMISDIRQSFERQPKIPRYFDLYGKNVILYDGFELQKIFGQAIPEEENNFNHIHLVFTDTLVCTFSEEDWHYHARTVVCGTPSIISIKGIVEAPAKPRDFYLDLTFGIDVDSAKKKIKGRFLDYGDDRIVDAATNYALQAIFFFLTDGDPFCRDHTCRLFNAHWQEELIEILENPVLCRSHREIADKFNLGLK